MALGNMGTDAKPAIPVLIRMLGGDDFVESSLAIGPLGNLALEEPFGEPSAKRALINALNRHRRWEIRQQIAQEVVNRAYREQDFVSALREWLTDTNPVARTLATDLLQRAAHRASESNAAEGKLPEKSE